MTTVFAPIRTIGDRVAALVARNGNFAGDPVRSGRTDPVGGDPKEQDAIAHAGGWRRSEPVDTAQDVGEQAARNDNLGHLERDVAPVAHDLRSDLDELLSQAGG